MKALGVDFRSPKRPPRSAWASLCVLVLISGFLTVVASVESKRLKQLVGTLSELQAQASARNSEPTPAPRKMPYDLSARAFIAQAASPWPSLLTALETVDVPGVTPTSIDVSPEERTLRLEVEFTDYATLLSYVDALNAGEPSKLWTMSEARTADQQVARGGGLRSTASIRARWSTP